MIEAQYLPGASLQDSFVPGMGGQHRTPHSNSNAAGFSIFETIAARKKALTVAELASLLNLGKRTVYDMIDSGRLPAIKIGSTVRLDPRTTAQWLRARLTN